MTRKQFKAVAEVCRVHLNRARNADANPGPSGGRGQTDAVLGMIEDLAAVYARENPNFDHGRFYAACGCNEDG